MLIIPCSRISRACLYNDKAKWIDTNGACHGGKIIWDGRYHMKYISSTSFSTSRVTWKEKGARVIQIQATVATTTHCYFLRRIDNGSGHHAVSLVSQSIFDDNNSMLDCGKLVMFCCRPKPSSKDTSPVQTGPLSINFPGS